MPTPQEPPTDETKISIANAAAICGRSVGTLRNYANRGLLTVFRGPGGRRYFLLAEVREIAPKAEAVA